ncbi:MAG: Rieske (2Fe-2S) protein [Candidatus Krumholzibacteriia bacterium]
MDRRHMIKWVIRSMGLAAAGMVGLPALVAGLAPVRIRSPRREVWRSLALVDDLPVGQMREIRLHLPAEPWGEALRERLVYAWRPAAGEVVVYSRGCTDLGCPLDFDPGSECFFCPCHGGVFDKHGERMAGPPSRPMDRYASRIVEGEILIDIRSVPPMA